MNKLILIPAVAAALLLAYAAQGFGTAAGPLPRGLINHLGKFTCDVFSPSGGDFVIQIQTAPEGGGPPTVFKTVDLSIGAGETKSLVVTGVPPFRQVVCIVDDDNVNATLSSLHWYGDSIESVFGVSGNTDILPDIN